ncbi:MAG TPA: signal peptide peptidase SppA [Opitutaceae bacterium]|nr:signal peptide peptidase SppA [Opitutaceae bacterium]
MKTFFASLLGTMVALFLFVVGLFLIGLGVLGVMASMGNKPVTVPAGSYLVFDLTANISDAPPRLGPLEIFEGIEDGDAPKSLQLRAITRSLRAAASDSRISGLYLTGRMSSDGYGSSLAALKEVRGALQAFRESGKPIVAYLTLAGTRDIYLASMANEVVLDPYGQIAMPGLASEPMFFAEALDKLGVGVQVARVGKYKSAIEPFTRTDLSDESREQLQKLLNDLWISVRDDIAEARSLKPDQLQALVDREGMIRPSAALEASLVTRIAYLDEVITDLKTRAGKSEKADSFPQVALAAYSRIARDRPSSSTVEAKDSGKAKKGRIAVVYAEGAIVEGEGGPSDVGGARFSKELRRLRQDKEVDAIVLRVNSPGGSATASEHILREVRLAQAAKPLIVSMGGYAASGGYWISAFGDRIFAEPSTITGSIGVFSVMFDVERLSKRLGVGFDIVKTGRFADLYSMSRPKSATELALFQRDADWIYQEFVSRVAEGRKLTPEAVEQVAQGRVWSGADAVKLGLVDELGGLDDAIRHAAERAGLGDAYTVREYPRVKPFAEALTEVLQGMQSSPGLLTQLADRIKSQAAVLEQFNDSRHVYARLPLEVRVD